MPEEVILTSFQVFYKKEKTSPPTLASSLSILCWQRERDVPGVAGSGAGGRALPCAARPACARGLPAASPPKPVPARTRALTQAAGLHGKVEVKTPRCF